MKLVPFIALGQFTAETLVASAALSARDRDQFSRHLAGAAHTDRAVLQDCLCNGVLDLARAGAQWRDHDPSWLNAPRCAGLQEPKMPFRTRRLLTRGTPHGQGFFARYQPESGPVMLLRVVSALTRPPIDALREPHWTRRSRTAGEIP
jgi:hypothetical protein